MYYFEHKDVYKMQSNQYSYSFSLLTLNNRATLNVSCVATRSAHETPCMSNRIMLWRSPPCMHIACLYFYRYSIYTMYEYVLLTPFTVAHSICNSRHTDTASMWPQKRSRQPGRYLIRQLLPCPRRTRTRRAIERERDRESEREAVQRFAMLPVRCDVIWRNEAKLGIATTTNSRKQITRIEGQRKSVAKVTLSNNCPHACVWMQVHINSCSCAQFLKHELPGQHWQHVANTQIISQNVREHDDVHSLSFVRALLLHTLSVCLSVCLSRSLCL